MTQTNQAAKSIREDKTSRRHTLFRQWLRRMGFNGHQVMTGAARIGINTPRIASAISTGKRELTLTERLAMSAVRAGLEPWSPEYDGELMADGRDNHEANAA